MEGCATMKNYHGGWIEIVVLFIVIFLLLMEVVRMVSAPSAPFGSTSPKYPPAAEYLG
jgi:hypothetical protein